MEYGSKLTDIIASLPEVNGGFLYSPNRGIYSNQTAGIADDISLQHVSVKLSKIVSMLAVHFQDTGGIRVTFKDLILYGLMIEDNHWLFLFHQPSLSPGMVKMTVQMALNIKGDDEEAQQHDSLAESIESGAIEETADGVDITNLMNSESELSEPLAAIQVELAEHIGPVAELVFQDAVTEWSSTSPSLESLPDLLSLLEDEIDDDEGREIFRNKLRSIAGTRE